MIIFPIWAYLIVNFYLGIKMLIFKIVKVNCGDAAA